jgi:excisionase family DNA binding protein
MMAGDNNDVRKRNLITMKAALAKAGFSRSKAYRLINDGSIVAYKRGGQTMIDADTIDAYHASLPRIEPRTKREEPV